MYTPPLESHKGENGKLLIIAGSRKYHGAAFFAIQASKRFVDLVYFLPGENDESLINCIRTIPEVIIVEKKIKVDCILFGKGLGNSKLKIPDHENLVIDADGLTGKMPKKSIITPHENEFRELFGLEGTKDNVKKIAKENQLIILKKGKEDIISDGNKIEVIRSGNPGLTKGGTGDLLSGLVAAFACKNNGYESCVAASKIIKASGDILAKKIGYNYCASDIVNILPIAYKKVIK